MSLADLQAWLISEGVGDDLAALTKLTVRSELSNLSNDADVRSAEGIDWPRLILAGSILARSDERADQEAALRIAVAAITLVEQKPVRDAGAVLLGKLSNFRSVTLAVERGLVAAGLDERLGIALRLESQRREMDHSVLVETTGRWMEVNEFQQRFWRSASNATWLSASAPTASGKTFLVLQWLVDQLGAGELTVAVYLAPTRALVSEIETSLEFFLKDTKGIEVSSLPLRACLSSRQPPAHIVFRGEHREPPGGAEGWGEMWTERHRARHAARLKQMVSSHAVQEVAGWLERADPPKSEGATPVLPIVRAIAWHLRVGGGWRALPPGMPPWRTVYGWFRRWLALGLFDRMMRDLARQRRRAAGRRPAPRLAIIDTQTVKCLPVRGPRGYDAAKRVVGRKRVALVDAEGNWLAVAVVPASVQDRDALPALDQGKAQWPGLRLAVFDGAFTAERCREWSNLHGMRHEIVGRSPDRKGFAVQPRRWVVERSFGCLTHWGGLLRDRPGRLDVAGARVACAVVLAATEALINPA